MNNIDIVTLNNGIKLVIKQNKETPRVAVNVFLDAGYKYEEKAGVSSLVSRLLLQGTKTRTAEELANELDLHAIDISISTREDYTKIRAVSLNEDLDKSIDILADIIKNSTFDDLEKEIKKFKGEIDVTLESPKAKAGDKLTKAMYPNHPYGNTYTSILEELPSITDELVRDFFIKHYSADNMIISIVGDVDKNNIINVLNEKFADMPVNKYDLSVETPASIDKCNLVTIEKEDAAQAQIYKGWIVPDISNKDFAALTIMNIILGSSGLSSRLFLELRDKKGLAYHVRSSFEPLKDSGVFTVYIGTAPQNINTCLEGFNVEIEKLKNELVSEQELDDAKNNYLGKRAFLHETNSQQSHYLGFYEIMGLGAGYDRTIPDMIKNVTSEDVQNVSKKYLTENSVISILAPKKYLDTIQNI